MAMPDINIDTDVPPTTTFTRYLNRKFYELTDHLGNVRAVLGDRKRTGSPGTGPYFGEIRSYQHVYPFGMPQPGRVWDSLSDYRYGFNGMETDGNVKEGEGKHYTSYFRQYDPRLGRWWSHDPVAQLGESPYAAMYNNPIGFSDPFGDCSGCDDPSTLETGTSQTVDGLEYEVTQLPNGEKVWSSIVRITDKRSTVGEIAANAGTTLSSEANIQIREALQRPPSATRPSNNYTDDQIGRALQLPPTSRQHVVTDGADFRQNSPFIGLGYNWTEFLRRYERGETNRFENFVYEANNFLWTGLPGVNYNLSGTEITQEQRENSFLAGGDLALAGYLSQRGSNQSKSSPQSIGESFTTRNVNAALNISREMSSAIPSWSGSGPTARVLGVNGNSVSVGALLNYYPRKGIEFVFDSKTGTFVVGKVRPGIYSGSPHQQLAQSINASGDGIVGGTLTRRNGGPIITTENSGHYGKFWNSAIREAFQEAMNNYGLPIQHNTW